MSSRKIRAYSVVSNPFRYGFLIMAKTLLEKNPDRSISFRVLHHPELSPLDPAHRLWLSERVPNLEFVEVDLAPYKNVFRLRDEEFKTPRRLWAAFLILDAFKDDADDAEVLCLDSDMICLGPLEEDLFVKSGFGAVEARTDQGVPRGFFNTGVMSIARDARGAEAFLRVMSVNDTSRYHPNSGRADQALLSLIYTPKNAASLPWRFNLTRRSIPTSGVQARLDEMRCVFFHYVGSKPWHVSLDPRDFDDHEGVAIWDQTVERVLDQDDYLKYLLDWRDVSRQKARGFAAEMKAAQANWSLTKKIKFGVVALLQRTRQRFSGAASNE